MRHAQVRTDVPRLSIRARTHARDCSWTYRYIYTTSIRYAKMRSLFEIVYIDLFDKIVFSFFVVMRCIVLSWSWSGKSSMWWSFWSWEIARLLTYICLLYVVKFKFSYCFIRYATKICFIIFESYSIIVNWNQRAERNQRCTEPLRL